MNIYILRRYLLFLVSLFVNALGVAFITKASLGTSPITGINYVLSMFTPLTMGEWTMIVNILFVIFELPLMSRALLKNDLRTFLSQIPISLCFGFFIDLSMNMLYWLEPYAYIGKVAALIAGCMILAAGIALEVKANIAMMAGEYFVKVISLRFKKDFGYVKLGFDITLVALACIVSIMAMSEIRGIREGTVTAALIVGPIVHFISPYYRKLDKWIAGEEKPARATAGKRQGCKHHNHIGPRIRQRRASARRTAFKRARNQALRQGIDYPCRSGKRNRPRLHIEKRAVHPVVLAEVHHLSQRRKPRGAESFARRCAVPLRKPRNPENSGQRILHNCGTVCRLRA